MIGTRSVSQYWAKKGLYRVIALITLWSFVITAIGGDLLHEISWAVDQPLELSSAGSNRYGSPFYYDSDNISIPKHLGTVKDTWTAPDNAKTIIHIQDAHANSHAQYAIVDIIDYLNREYGIKTINLEGGKGDYDLSLFTDIQNITAREKIADYFIKEGVVSAAEYYAINNPKKVTLWGIEDTELYVKNLSVYRDSLKYKDLVDKYLASLGHILSNLKIHIYSEPLLEFDKHYCQYKAGNLDFKAYISILFYLAANNAIDIKGFTNLFLLFQSLEMEETIDFDAANEQRGSLIDSLQKMLSKSELEILAAKIIHFKNHKISDYEFYSYLLEKANLIRFNLDGLPELKKYIVYISTYHAIDKSSIMNEVDGLETKIKAGFFENETQMELDTLSRNFALMKNIFNVSLTKIDYIYYQENKESFAIANYIRFIDKYVPLYNIKSSLDKDIVGLDQYRDKITEFYEYSFKRDKAFVDNIIFAENNKYEEEGQDVAIIITGGFHTENLCELFKENNISYVSIMPDFISSEGYECPYFSLLSGGVSEFEESLSSALSSIQIASLMSQLDISSIDPQRKELFRLGIIALRAMYNAERPQGVKLTDDQGYMIFDWNNGSPVCEIRQDKENADIVAEDIGKNAGDILYAFHEIGIDRIIRKAFADNTAKSLADIDSGADIITDVSEKLKSSGATALVEELDKLKYRMFIIPGLLEAHAGGRGLYLPETTVDGRALDRGELTSLIVHELSAGVYRGTDDRRLDSHQLAQALETALMNNSFEEARDLIDQARRHDPEKSIWQMTDDERRALERDYAADEPVDDVTADDARSVVDALTMPELRLVLSLLYYHESGSTKDMNTLLTEEQILLAAEIDRKLLVLNKNWRRVIERAGSEWLEVRINERLGVPERKKIARNLKDAPLFDSLIYRQGIIQDEVDIVLQRLQLDISEQEKEMLKKRVVLATPGNIFRAVLRDLVNINLVRASKRIQVGYALLALFGVGVSFFSGSLTTGACVMAAVFTVFNLIMVPSRYVTTRNALQKGVLGGVTEGGYVLLSIWEPVDSVDPHVFQSYVRWITAHEFVHLLARLGYVKNIYSVASTVDTLRRQELYPDKPIEYRYPVESYVTELIEGTRGSEEDLYDTVWQEEWKRDTNNLAPAGQLLRNLVSPWSWRDHRPWRTLGAIFLSIGFNLERFWDEEMDRSYRIGNNIAAYLLEKYPGEEDQDKRWAFVRRQLGIRKLDDSEEAVEIAGDRLEQPEEDIEIQRWGLLKEKVEKGELDIETVREGQRLLNSLTLWELTVLSRRSMDSIDGEKVIRDHSDPYEETTLERVQVKLAELNPDWRGILKEIGSYWLTRICADKRGKTKKIHYDLEQAPLFKKLILDSGIIEDEIDSVLELLGLDIPEREKQRLHSFFVPATKKNMLKAAISDLFKKATLAYIVFNAALFGSFGLLVYLVGGPSVSMLVGIGFGVSLGIISAVWTQYSSILSLLYRQGSTAGSVVGKYMLIPVNIYPDIVDPEYIQATVRITVAHELIHRLGDIGYLKAYPSLATTVQELRKKELNPEFPVGGLETRERVTEYLSDDSVNEGNIYDIVWQAAWERGLEKIRPLKDIIRELFSIRSLRLKYLRKTLRDLLERNIFYSQRKYGREAVDRSYWMGYVMGAYLTEKYPNNEDRDKRWAFVRRQLRVKERPLSFQRRIIDDEVSTVLDRLGIKLSSRKEKQFKRKLMPATLGNVLKAPIMKYFKSATLMGMIGIASLGIGLLDGGGVIVPSAISAAVAFTCILFGVFVGVVLPLAIELTFKDENEAIAYGSAYALLPVYNEKDMKGTSQTVQGYRKWYEENQRLLVAHEALHLLENSTTFRRIHGLATAVRHLREEEIYDRDDIKYHKILEIILEQNPELNPADVYDKIVENVKPSLWEMIKNLFKFYEWDINPPYETINDLRKYLSNEPDWTYDAGAVLAAYLVHHYPGAEGRADRWAYIADRLGVKKSEDSEGTDELTEAAEPEEEPTELERIIQKNQTAIDQGFLTEEEIARVYEGGEAEARLYLTEKVEVGVKSWSQLLFAIELYPEVVDTLVLDLDDCIWSPKGYTASETWYHDMRGVVGYGAREMRNSMERKMAYAGLYEQTEPDLIERLLAIRRRRPEMRIFALTSRSTDRREVTQRTLDLFGLDIEVIHSLEKYDVLSGMYDREAKPGGGLWLFVDDLMEDWDLTIHAADMADKGMVFVKYEHRTDFRIEKSSDSLRLCLAEGNLVEAEMHILDLISLADVGQDPQVRLNVYLDEDIMSLLESSGERDTIDFYLKSVERFENDGLAESFDPEDIQRLREFVIRLKAGLAGEEQTPSAGAIVRYGAMENEKAGEYILEKIRGMDREVKYQIDAETTLRYRRKMLDNMIQYGEAYRRNGVVFIRIDGLFRETGQYAHIGFGQTYGQTVAYIDTQYSRDEYKSKIIEGHELTEIRLWQEAHKNHPYLKGVDEFSGIRNWMRDNKRQAFELRKQFHIKANWQYNIDLLDLFSKQEIDLINAMVIGADGDYPGAIAVLSGEREIPGITPYTALRYLGMRDEYDREGRAAKEGEFYDVRLQLMNMVSSEITGRYFGIHDAAAMRRLKIGKKKKLAMLQKLVDDAGDLLITEAPYTRKPAKILRFAGLSYKGIRLINAFALAADGKVNEALNILASEERVTGISPYVALKYMILRNKYDVAKGKPALFAKSNYIRLRKLLRDGLKRNERELGGDWEGLYEKYFASGGGSVASSVMSYWKGSGKGVFQQFVQETREDLIRKLSDEDKVTQRRFKEALDQGIPLRIYAPEDEDDIPVTYEYLALEGHAPLHRIRFGDDTYYISRPFIGPDNRISFIAYCQHIDSRDNKPKLFVNEFYFSGSHAVWRAASHRAWGWIGKGVDEHSQTLPLEIIPFLNRIVEKAGNIETREYDLFKILGIGGIIPAESQIFTHVDVLNGQRAAPELDLTGSRRIVVAEEVSLAPADSDELHRYRFPDEGYKPDFTSKKILRYPSRNDVYGRITHYRILSRNKKLQYLFNVSEEGLVWIGSVQSVSKDLNRQGVRQDAPNIIVPPTLLQAPYDYPSEIVKNLPQGYLGDDHPGHPEYASAAKFTEKIDLVVEFRAEVLSRDRPQPSGDGGMLTESDKSGPLADGTAQKQRVAGELIERMLVMQREGNYFELEILKNDLSSIGEDIPDYLIAVVRFSPNNEERKIALDAVHRFNSVLAQNLALEMLREDPDSPDGIGRLAAFILGSNRTVEVDRWGPLVREIGLGRNVLLVIAQVLANTVSIRETLWAALPQRRDLRGMILRTLIACRDEHALGNLMLDLRSAVERYEQSQDADRHQSFNAMADVLKLFAKEDVPPDSDPFDGGVVPRGITQILKHSGKSTREEYSGLMGRVASHLDYNNPNHQDLLKMIVEILSCDKSELSASILWNLYERIPEQEFRLIVTKALASVGDPAIPFLARIESHTGQTYQMIGSINTDKALEYLVDRFRDEQSNKKKNFVANVIQSMGADAVNYLSQRLGAEQGDNKYLCNLIMRIHSVSYVPTLLWLIVKTNIGRDNKLNAIEACGSFRYADIREGLMQTGLTRPVFKILSGYLEESHQQPLPEESIQGMSLLLRATAGEDDIDTLNKVYVTSASNTKCAILGGFGGLADDLAVRRSLTAVSSGDEEMARAGLASLISMTESQSTAEYLTTYLNKNEGERDRLVDSLGTMLLPKSDREPSRYVGDVSKLFAFMVSQGVDGSSRCIEIMAYNLRRSLESAEEQGVVISLEYVRGMMGMGSVGRDLLRESYTETVIQLDNHFIRGVLERPGDFLSFDILESNEGRIFEFYEEWLEFIAIPQDRGPVSFRGYFQELARVTDLIVRAKKDLADDPEIDTTPYSRYLKVMGENYYGLEGLSERAKARYRVAILKYFRDRANVRRIAMVANIEDGEIITPEIAEDDLDKKAFLIKMFGFVPERVHVYVLPDCIHCVLDVKSYSRLRYRVKTGRLQNGPNDGFELSSLSEQLSHYDSGGFFFQQDNRKFANVRIGGILTYEVDKGGSPVIERRRRTQIHEGQHKFIYRYAGGVLGDRFPQSLDTARHMAQELNVYRKDNEDTKARVDALVNEISGYMLSLFQNEFLARNIEGDWEKGELPRWLLTYMSHFGSAGEFHEVLGDIGSERISTPDIQNMAPPDMVVMKMVSARISKTIKASVNAVGKAFDVATQRIMISQGVEESEAREQARGWVSMFLQLIPITRFNRIERHLDDFIIVQLQHIQEREEFGRFISWLVKYDIEIAARTLDILIAESPATTGLQIWMHEVSAEMKRVVDNMIAEKKRRDQNLVRGDLDERTIRSQQREAIEDGWALAWNLNNYEEIMSVLESEGDLSPDQCSRLIELLDFDDDAERERVRDIIRKRIGRDESYRRNYLVPALRKQRETVDAVDVDSARFTDAFTDSETVANVDKLQGRRFVVFFSPSDSFSDGTVLAHSSANKGEGGSIYTHVNSILNFPVDSMGIVLVHENNDAERGRHEDDVKQDIFDALVKKPWNEMLGRGQDRTLSGKIDSLFERSRAQTIETDEPIVPLTIDGRSIPYTGNRTGYLAALAQLSIEDNYLGNGVREVRLAQYSSGEVRTVLVKDKNNMFLVCLKNGQVVEVGLQMSGTVEDEFGFLFIDDNELRRVVQTRIDEHSRRHAGRVPQKRFMPEGRAKVMGGFVSDTEVKEAKKEIMRDPLLSHLFGLVHDKYPGINFRGFVVVEIPQNYGGTYNPANGKVSKVFDDDFNAGTYAHEITHHIYTALIESRRRVLFDKAVEGDAEKEALFKRIDRHFGEFTHERIFDALRYDKIYRHRVLVDPVYLVNETLAYIAGAVFQRKVREPKSGYRITFADIQLLVDLGILPESYGNRELVKDLQAPIPENF